MTPAISPEFERLSEVLAQQYRIERELGRGGMGVVLEALDLRLDRRVAIKTLPYHLSDDPEIRERFLREARTAAALSHPNIVPIYHAAEAGGEVFFVMGYVDGGSVAQLVRAKGPLPALLVVSLLKDVAGALEYAHHHGVVHRDIKAENILIDSSTGSARVTDFGIARLAETAPLTATGTVLGTVHYMSPEQVNGEPLDGRSDLYALGVLAFYMLSGRFPFDNEAASAVLVAHVTRRPPSLKSVIPSIPSDVAAIIDKLLSKSPDDRYLAAADLIEALRTADVASHSVAPTPTEAVLSSEEANNVWERAALLQQMTGQHSPPTPPRVTPVRSRAAPAARLTEGYRMNDVLAAAQEAGIDRKYVERALAERDPGVTTTPGASLVKAGAAMLEKPNVWLGARTRLEYEAVVDGELRPSDMGALVDELRRCFGEFGTPGAVGRTITFTAEPPSVAGSHQRKLQVTITPRNGRTTIRAFEDIRQLAAGIVGGVAGGVGGGVGGAAAGILINATQSPLIGFSAMFAIAGLSYVGARIGVRRYSDKRSRELRESVDRIARSIAELSSEG